MQMNWKVRFKNKIWLSSFIAAIVSFTYTILGMFDIAPEVTQNLIMSVINGILMILSVAGIIVDPTTQGISDSNRAMTYSEPYRDEEEIAVDEEG